ncbi:Septum formation initiator [Hoyosella subflava DQS3-9A1]|uniref:Septum formation initiator n=2 Tax=Hoyosella TaxID=697025 RepID=F6EQN7_HOYSD|nr:Septum formation initiator [Hoyosella subflava DQS3-9A1]
MKGAARIKAVGTKAMRSPAGSKLVRPSGGAADMGWSTRRTFILVLVAGALVLTLVMPLRTYFAQLGEARRISAEYQVVYAEVEELKQQKELQADPAYIRAEARERLGLVFPGETAYKVQFEDDPRTAQEDEVVRPGSADPWYTQLWGELAVPRDQGPQREMNLPIAPIEPEAGP